MPASRCTCVGDLRDDWLGRRAWVVIVPDPECPYPHQPSEETTPWQ